MTTYYIPIKSGVAPHADIGLFTYVDTPKFSFTNSNGATYILNIVPSLCVQPLDLSGGSCVIACTVPQKGTSGYDIFYEYLNGHGYNMQSIYNSSNPSSPYTIRTSDTILYYIHCDSASSVYEIGFNVYNNSVLSFGTSVIGSPAWNSLGPITRVIPPLSNICFVGDTPIDTDQGPIEISQLDQDCHTINGNRIAAITKTTSTESHLIQIDADAIAPKQPSRTTIVSPLHKILYNGHMTCARDILEGRRIPYKGQILYNVLLESYATMSVNNLTVETLHPTNRIGSLYRFIRTQCIDSSLQNKLFKALNVTAI